MNPEKQRDFIEYLIQEYPEIKIKLREYRKQFTQTKHREHRLMIGFEYVSDSVIRSLEL